LVLHEDASGIAEAKERNILSWLERFLYLSEDKVEDSKAKPSVCLMGAQFNFVNWFWCSFIELKKYVYYAIEIQRYLQLLLVTIIRGL